MEKPFQSQTRNTEFPALLQKGELPKGRGKTADVSLKDEMDAESKEDLIYREVVYQLEVKKIFLDSKLTLTKLSSIIGTNTTYLSNTVNSRFGVNLRTLVNRYRVQHAAQLMDEGVESYEEVVAECGFTSRTVFYRAFKQELGIPPGRFIRLRENKLKYE